MTCLLEARSYHLVVVAAQILTLTMATVNGHPKFPPYGHLKLPLLPVVDQPPLYLRRARSPPGAIARPISRESTETGFLQFPESKRLEVLRSNQQGWDLQVLLLAGIVNRRRVGRESRFAIRLGTITQAKDYLTRVSDQWDEAIARLRAAVEQ